MFEQKKSPGFAPSMLLAASCLAGLAVALGAFGAHALKPMLSENGMIAVWETAVDYQFWHALALLAFSLQPDLAWRRAVRWVAAFFVVGVILFSGSLYGLSLGGPRWLGPVTPLGGTCFLIGWGILIVLAAKRLKQSHR